MISHLIPGAGIECRLTEVLLHVCRFVEEPELPVGGGQVGAAAGLVIDTALHTSQGVVIASERPQRHMRLSLVDTDHSRVLPVMHC